MKAFKSHPQRTSLYLKHPKSVKKFDGNKSPWLRMSKKKENE